jgi:hypothetical protein
MKTSEHLTKADAFERSAAKLDPTQDTALYVVMLLRAATNRVNAALHVLGTTTTEGAATSVKLGDLNHTYKPKLNVPVPIELRAAFENLALIEDLRTDYVRGNKSADTALLNAWRAAYAGIRRDTDPMLTREHP